MAGDPGIEVAPSCTGVVRRRLEQATLERIVQGLWGYVTTLAVLCDRPELEDALLEVRRHLELYIAAKQRSFRAEVARKRARRLRVTAFLETRTRRRPEWGYMRLVRPIFVDQLCFPDASRRAGSAGVSAALPEFYIWRRGGV